MKSHGFHRGTTVCRRMTSKKRSSAGCTACSDSAGSLGFAVKIKMTLGWTVQPFLTCLSIFEDKEHFYILHMSWCSLGYWSVFYHVWGQWTSILGYWSVLICFDPYWRVLTHTANFVCLKIGCPQKWSSKNGEDDQPLSSDMLFPNLSDKPRGPRISHWPCERHETCCMNSLCWYLVFTWGPKPMKMWKWRRTSICIHLSAIGYWDVCEHFYHFWSRFFSYASA